MGGDQASSVRSPNCSPAAAGKAIKVVSALIPSLPTEHQYRVIFMNRPIQEVVASQKKMIDRRGVRGANLPPEKLATTLSQHRATILRGMKASPNFEVLEVNYPELVADPTVWLERINIFLGGNLNTSAMSRCVKPSLHRNRGSAIAVS